MGEAEVRVMIVDLTMVHSHLRAHEEHRHQRDGDDDRDRRDQLDRAPLGRWPEGQKARPANPQPARRREREDPRDDQEHHAEAHQAAELHQRLICWIASGRAT